MALKLDLQKAYDRLNWNFLQTVLNNFGFHDTFVNWVMQCVTTVSFSVLINGGKSKHFTPTRELRQGDPLSPYLFILFQEVLSKIIDREHAAGKIMGVAMNRGGTDFTHVMFADDIMLFAKASNREMKKVPDNANYLGAPLFSSRSRSKDFKYLQDKLEARLKGWRSKCLSWAGHCTLIKTVAQAIPTYTFSTFDVPNVICDKLDAATRRFWWNPKKENGRFLAWKSWDHLFSPCMEALRSKYKVTDTWLREEPRKYVSHTWKAMERLKHLITKGACFLVSDGSLIDVWKDPWIPWLSNFLPKPNASYNDPTPMKVSCLIDSTFRCWIDTKLSDIFDEETIMAIKKIPIPASQATDKLVWILDSKGNFSVKLVFNTNQQPLVEDDDGLWKKLWKLKIHERYRVLVWRIATGILPTRLNLTSKMVARAIWFGTSWAVHANHFTVNSNLDIIKLLCDPSLPTNTAVPSRDIIDQTTIQFVTTLNCIWNLRNHVVHKDHNFNILVVIKNLEIRIMEHIQALVEPNFSDETKENNSTVWQAPQPGSIKLNVDASILSDKAFIAVIARDSGGSLVKAWTKQAVTLDPAMAEAAAINWSLELAWLKVLSTF
uniref:Reverse transcriptase domain-containing protein n=1 Tax=Fagus sylvatica TaxID=28930 RepID=A0A2N9EEZ1_FAGSY